MPREANSLLDHWVQEARNKVIRFARRSPQGKLASVGRVIRRFPGACKDGIDKLRRRSQVPHWGNDRTAYLIGLGNTGLDYLTAQLQQNLGKRGKNVMYGLRLHPGPTSMVYWGHATLKHVGRDHELPELTHRLLESVRSGTADLILLHRHPLDSLLSIWVYVRSFLGYSEKFNISSGYKDDDDFCAELERNFVEFKSFADGAPDFFGALGGPRCLSFPEFVEESELFSHFATIILRFEDFMVDPNREFAKIAKVMSVDLDSSRLNLPPPRTKPYRYRAVKEKVPRFRDYIEGLDAETKRRLGKIGYDW